MGTGLGEVIELFRVDIRELLGVKFSLQKLYGTGRTFRCVGPPAKDYHHLVQLPVGCLVDIQMFHLIHDVTVENNICMPSVRLNGKSPACQFSISPAVNRSQAASYWFTGLLGEPIA